MIRPAGELGKMKSTYIRCTGVFYRPHFTVLYFVFGFDPLNVMPIPLLLLLLFVLCTFLIVSNFLSLFIYLRIAGGTLV